MGLKSFWWWSYFPPPPYSLPPFSPSLIRLVISVYVKHHVYLRSYRTLKILHSMPQFGGPLENQNDLANTKVSVFKLLKPDTVRIREEEDLSWSEMAGSKQVFPFAGFLRVIAHYLRKKYFLLKIWPSLQDGSLVSQRRADKGRLMWKKH